MATQSSILAWRIPWTEETGGLQSTGQKSDTTKQLTHTHIRMGWWPSDQPRLEGWNIGSHPDLQAFLAAQLVKNPPANVGGLDSIPGLERPSGEQTATHSSILAWRIPWTV